MDIVLGGTHGLGAELAARLLRPFVIGRSYNATQHGAGMAADLARTEDVARIVELILSSELNSFYWVAGYGYAGDFADQLDVLPMGAVNFTHVLPIAQAAWTKLGRTGGQFVVVSSTAGVKPRANEAVYAATKHAQVGFTRSLGLEAERLALPVKVALFLPHGMQTSFWNESRPDNFMTFLDPAKVADAMLQDIHAQQTVYYERMIELADS